MRRHFDRDARRLSYLDAPATGEGPPRGTLVLLHAFPLAAEMWQPQLEARPPGWRVIAPDLAGFGQSGPAAPGDAGIDDDARDVLALLDHLRLDAVVAGGLSMGGYVAFALHRLAPGRLRGLVLADTRPEADGEEARAGRARMLETLERQGPAAVAEAMIPRLLGATTRATRPEVVDGVRALASSQSPEGIGRAVRALRSRPDATGQLRRITVPALVVVGEEDEITGPDVARQMHAQIPGAEIALIPGAGHLSNLEWPEAFDAALARFLATRF